MSEALLTLEHIETFYGPVQVHFDVNFEVRRGQIVSLHGGNASGKSTTMKLILGLHKPRSGNVTFEGESITSLATPQIVRRGVGSVPEARRLFGDMTVRENLLMGAYTRRDRPAINEDYECEGTSCAARRDLVRWRAADAGDGTRADEPPEADLHGRADDGLVAVVCR
jgi:branched-chain amino acid transport system ATP-binding protein